MSPEDLYAIALAGRYFVPVAVTASIVFALRKPESMKLRALLAVIIAWFIQILYTIHVYNPAGVAMGHATGEHFPEGRFDNNTVAVTLLAGWFLPTVVAIACAAASHLARLRRR